MEGDVLERELAYQKEIAEQHLADLVPIAEDVIARYAKHRHWRIYPKDNIFRVIGQYASQFDRELTACEFGCGDASKSCELAKVFPHIKFCAFDVSPELIEVANSFDAEQVKADAEACELSEEWAAVSPEVPWDTE